MIRSILVPIDGSDSSRSALSVASSIAALCEARLHGLFVEDTRRFMQLNLSAEMSASLGLTPAIFTPLNADQALEEMEHVEKERGKVKELFETACREADIRGEFRSESGLTALDILQAARKADLVIMGNSGAHTSMKYLESGETTKAVAKSCSVPVLVVPEGAIGEPRIVVGFDDSPPAQRAIRFAAELASIIAMDVHVVTVDTDTARAEERLALVKAYFECYGRDVTVTLRRGNVVEALRSYADEVDASIVALGSYGSHKMKEAFFGSTVDAFLKDPDSVAVLLVA